MPARRYVLAIQELSYGNPNLTGGAPTTGAFKYLRLSEGDGAFVAEETPVHTPIAYGGGRSTDAEAISDAFEVRGSLETWLYPATADLLVPWLGTPINAGRTAPWTTTDASAIMPPGDLASLSFVEAVWLPDGTYTYTAYRGCKCADWSIGAGVQERKFRLRCSFVGKSKASTTVTEGPAPAETDYPTDPYLLSHVANGTGTFKIGTSRTGANAIQSVEVRGTNNLDPRFFEATTVGLILFTGRQITAAATLRLKPTPDDRAAFTAKTDQDSEFKVDNGTKTMLIDLHAKNRIFSYSRQLGPQEFLYNLELRNRWDPTAATDATFTLT